LWCQLPAPAESGSFAPFSRKTRNKLATSLCYCAIKERKVLSRGRESIFGGDKLSSNRPFRCVVALAFIGLAVCVCIWGLQYKLSLYDPPQAASHHIPTAKLLSENERSSSTESPSVVRTRTSTRVNYTVASVFPFFLLLILSILNPPLSSHREQRASQSWHLRRADLRAHFVRPPPVLA
jgi:hypothetical protein